MRRRVYFILAVAMLAACIGAGVVWWVKPQLMYPEGDFIISANKSNYECGFYKGQLIVMWTSGLFEVSKQDQIAAGKAGRWGGWAYSWNYAGIAYNSIGLPLNRLRETQHIIPSQSIAIDFSLFATLAGLLAVLFFWRYRVARRTYLRSRTGLCPSCGYDLRASPGRCPECGAVPTAT
jgi:hypothetical protein